MTDPVNVIDYQATLAYSSGRWQVSSLVLQQHFVVIGLSSLVVADFGAVLVASAPARPG